MRFLWQRAVWPVSSEAVSLAVRRRNEKGVHFIWLQISWRWPSPQSCVKPSLFSPLRRTKLFRYKLAASGSYAPVYRETSTQSNPVRMD